MTMRVERSAHSGERRTGVKITDSRGGNKSRQHGKPADEVDAVRNPTELFRRINSGDWEGALNAVQSNPVEASVWISRRKNNEDGLAWKYLPLHLICLQQRPPLELLVELLHFYPPAASVSTPHDGNLPIHYVCESGCDDEHVFAALLASFPKSLEIKNNKEKTPLLVCQPKSRGVLMKVLRQRKPMPFNDGQQQNKRDKDRKSNRSSRKGAERRNDIDTTWKDPTSSGEYRQTTPHRRPPQTMPARYATNRQSIFADIDEPSGWDNTKTPKASNVLSGQRRSSKKQVAKEEPSSFFPTAEEEPSSLFPTAAPSSSSGDETDTATYISSKTTELALSALNYLYPSYQDSCVEPQPQPQPQQERDNDEPLQEQVNSLTKENAAQKRAIAELTKKLEKLPSSNETNTENSQLCERILAKAEADNVAFRTQIQKLRDEKEGMKRASDMKEKASKKRFDQMRKILCDKGTEMKIDVFNDGSCRSNGSGGSRDRDQTLEALKTVLSHMDERNDNLHSNISSLEADNTKFAASLKMTQSKNQALQGEKDATTKRHRELERKVAIMDEEKGVVHTGLGDLKDRISTLTVINQSLQEQVDSMSGSQIKQENQKFRSELNRMTEKLVQLKEEKDNTLQSQYDRQVVADMEEKIESLLEKNRSLKDTILLNNEKYSKKVQELGQKLEKANKELTQSLARRVVTSATQADLRVHLVGENKLLYEV